MKPHNKTKRHPAFATRTDLMLERIKALTAELQGLQEEIVDQMSTGHLGPLFEMPKPAPGQDASVMRVLNQFRAALDRIRTMLWLYAEIPVSEMGTGDAHRDRQVARATELLRALGAQAAFTASSPSPQMCESGSFFDRLDRVIDNYVQDGKPLLESSQRRRPKQ